MKAEFIIVIFIMILIIRTLIVFLHEMGHAVTALLLTKEKVLVYMGSYGGNEGSKKLAMGKIEIRFNYQSLWKNGLCRPTAQNIPPIHQIIYILAGPLLPFFTALILWKACLLMDANNIVTGFCLLFLILSGFDLVLNLFPSSRPILLDNGNKTYNDGQNILLSIRYMRYPKEYFDAVTLYDNKEYQEALPILEQVYTKKKHAYTLRLIIACQIQLALWNDALESANEFGRKFVANSDDFTNFGIIYSYLGREQEAIQHYDISLRLNPKNKYSLNNKGYSFTILERFDEAIPLLDASILIDEKFSFPYNNRGLAKIRLGLIESGFDDIMKSLELDPENPYSFRNLGIYYKEIGDYGNAMEYFKKTKALKPDLQMIDELISETGSQFESH